MVILEKHGLRVSFDTTSRDARKIVKKSLSFFHPDAPDMPTFLTGKWDGIIRYYTSKSDFGVGLLSYVTKALDKVDIEYELKGFEPKFTEDYTFSVLFLVDERDYQREAVSTFLDKGCGIIKVPTRGGKTFIAAETIRILRENHSNCNYLLLTDVSDALDQNRADLALILGLNIDDIGIIQGDKIDIKPITVGMIQTVQSIMKIEKEDTKKYKDMMKYLKSVYYLGIDEIHEWHSKPRMRIIKLCRNAEWVMAISATPDKKSDKIGTLNIDNLVGGIIYTVPEKTLVEKEVLAKNKILLLWNDIEHQAKYDNMDYHELEKELIQQSNHRNQVLHTVSQVCGKLGLKTLVMFSSIEHGEYMEAMTDEFFLHGEHDKEVRDYVKNWFLDNDGQVLFVSHIWKKAITLPEVEVFLNASGGKEQTMIIQKRGRMLGVTKTKRKALYIDIIDSYPRYFNEHGLSRIKAYQEKVDESDIDFIDTYDGNFEQQLESYIVNWFVHD